MSVQVPVSEHSEELTRSADETLEWSSSRVNSKGIRCFPEETLQVWALCKGASSCGDSPGKRLLWNKPKDWPKGQQTSDDVGVSPSPLWQRRLSFPLENPNHTHCYFHDLSWVLRRCQELLGRWRSLDEMWLSWKVLLLFGLRGGGACLRINQHGEQSAHKQRKNPMPLYNWSACFNSGGCRSRSIPFAVYCLSRSFVTGTKEIH